MMKDKPGILIELQDDGSIRIGTNIEDKTVLRQLLKSAEESVITDALKKASVQQQVIPVHTMSKLMTKPS